MLCVLSHIFSPMQLEASFIDLLIPNLLRLNDIAPPEADATAIANAESDANAIYHLLGSLENLLSLKPAVARPLVDSALLKWLLQCVGRKGKYEQNRGYAAELLAVLVQGEEAQYVCEKLGSAGGMDDLLQVLSVSGSLRVQQRGGLTHALAEIPQA